MCNFSLLVLFLKSKRTVKSAGREGNLPLNVVPWLLFLNTMLKRSLLEKHQRLWCRFQKWNRKKIKIKPTTTILHVLNIFLFQTFFYSCSMFFLCFCVSLIFTLNNPQVIFVIVIKNFFSLLSSAYMWNAQFWYLRTE